MLKHEHCEPASLATRDDNAPAAHGTRGEVRHLGGQRGPDPSAPPHVDDEGVVCTHADESFGSSPSRGAEPTTNGCRQQYAHLARLSSGAAIDTARAAGKGCNCECLLYTPRACSHRLLDAVHEQIAAALLDTGASHQAGEESLVPRSDPLSKKRRKQVGHTQTRVRVRR